MYRSLYKKNRILKEICFLLFLLMCFLPVADAVIPFAFVKNNTPTELWRQQAYIKAANADTGDGLGTTVAISGDTMVVGAPAERSNQTSITNGTGASADNSIVGAGAVYIYVRTAGSWVQQAYIKAVNTGMSNSGFGSSVAIDGDTLVVGASSEDSSQTTITNGTTASSDHSAAGAGAVYVYVRTGTTWAQQAYIKAVNAEAGDRFGNSVTLSGDTVVVGAWGEASAINGIINGGTASSNNSQPNTGAVYIYKRSGTNWSQEAYIKPINASQGAAAAHFGSALAMDENTLVVGVQMEKSNQTFITNGTTASSNASLTYAGAVYVYFRTGATWAQQAYIKAANVESNDSFGGSVSISGDTIVVGATGEDGAQSTITNGTGVDYSNGASTSGAVYVYHRTAANWSQQAYVKGSGSGSLGISYYFGSSVSIEADSLAVGSSNDKSNRRVIINGTGAPGIDSVLNSSGAVYLYKRSGTSWVQQAYIKTVNADSDDYLATDSRSVSISGNTVAVADSELRATGRDQDLGGAEDHRI